MPALTRTGIRPVLPAVFMAAWEISKMFLKGFYRPALAFGGIVLVWGNTCLTGQTPRLVVPIGHRAAVTSVAFSPDGKNIITGGDNGIAMLWNSDGRVIQFSKDITSIAFSPDGKQILTGNKDKTTKLWNLPSEYSNRLHSSDSLRRRPSLYRYRMSEIKTFSGHADWVSAVTFSPNGDFILTGSRDKSVKLWRLDGNEIRSFKFERTITSAVFSPDGKNVLTNGGEKSAVLWDITNGRTLSLQGHTDDITAVAISPDGKFMLTGSKDKTAMLWDMAGKKIVSYTGHTRQINAVAFSPDGNFVLTGSSDGIANLWNIKGEKIISLNGYYGEVNSVSFSPDGKLILTGSSNGSVKLWDRKIGKERATLMCFTYYENYSNFINYLQDIILGRELDWAITTPTGLFDASPRLIDSIYYQFGDEKLVLEQMKQRYYEPRLYTKIISLDESGLRNTTGFNKIELFPTITANIHNNWLNINLKERSGGLGKISLYVNNKEVAEDINPMRQKKISIDLNTYAKFYQLDTINTIALRSYNKDGWLKSLAYKLEYRPLTTTNYIRKTAPHLYAIVVGTSNYTGERLDLRYADQDANAMSQALRNASGALFGGDHLLVRLLSTSPGSVTDAGINNNISSKTNIHQAFADIAAKAEPADILVIYFSGHGLAYGPAEKEQFYYLTKDIGSEDLSDPVMRDNYTISSNELTQWLTAIPAQKQVMILDACNAGKVVESLAAIAQKDFNPSQIRALDRMKDRTGMFILTGSAADKVSYEASQYGQGLLTYSLLQGMSGLALTDDKRVDVMTLFQYSRDKVPELAKGIGGIQTPVLAFPAGGASFDIGMVDASVHIPVAHIKPVFIRNNFTNDDSFTDDLKLTKALENYFREITAKGALAELIYVDVSEYENAYSIKGRYTVTGESVQVRGRLFKGETAVGGEFQVTGEKSDLQGLVEGIVDKVSGIIK